MRKLGVFVAIALSAGVAAAQPAQPAAAVAPAPARPSEAPLPSCLDQSLAGELGSQLKPRGVQKKTFLKRHKVMIVGHGGHYGGDLTSSSWIAGGALGWFFTEDFGVQAEVDVTPMRLDLDSPLTKFFGDTRFEPGTAYLALANAVWAPMHAKMKMGGGIVHADIMLFAGGGRLLHESVQGMSFDGGAAIDLFVTKLLTIRLDARDLIAVQEIAGETHLTNNLIATAGFVVWIPTGL